MPNPTIAIFLFLIIEVISGQTGRLLYILVAVKRLVKIFEDYLLCKKFQLRCFWYCLLFSSKFVSFAWQSPGRNQESEFSNLPELLFQSLKTDSGYSQELRCLRQSHKLSLYTYPKGSVSFFDPKFLQHPPNLYSPKA